jgi:hypothetical protein
VHPVDTDDDLFRDDNLGAINSDLKDHCFDKVYCTSRRKAEVRTRVFFFFTSRIFLIIASNVKINFSL